MKHRHHNRILGRSAAHRGQLLQNLTSSLLTHGSIVTSEAKAKELRKHIEPLITRAKQELTLANRRHLLRQLGQREDIDRLVEVAQRSAKRPGGYLRLTRLPATRADNATVVRVDIVDA